MKFEKEVKKPFEDFKEIIQRNSKLSKFDNFVEKYCWYIILAPTFIFQLTEKYWEPQLNSYIKNFMENDYVLLAFGLALTFFMLRVLNNFKFFTQDDIKSYPAPLKLLMLNNYLTRMLIGKKAYDLFLLIGVMFSLLLGCTFILFALVKIAFF